MTQNDQMRLALKAGVSWRTVYRYLRGENKTHHLTIRALEEAARELGIKLPEPQRRVS